MVVVPGPRPENQECFDLESLTNPKYMRKVTLTPSTYWRGGVRENIHQDLEAMFDTPSAADLQRTHSHYTFRHFPNTRL